MNKDTNIKITINYEWCKACGLCVYYCPKGIFQENKQGKPVVTKEHGCTRCCRCEYMCPDFAITVLEQNGHLTK